MPNRKQIALYILAGVVVLLVCVRALVTAALPPQPPPAPAVTEEIRFVPSLESGVPVFEEIVSIQPVLGIAGSGGLFHAYFCDCGTADGKTVYAYISAADYKQYFDPDMVRPSISSKVSIPGKHFKEPRTLHGTVRDTASYSVRVLAPRDWSESGGEESLANAYGIPSATVIDVETVD